MAPGDCLGRQVQVRAGREHQPQDVAHPLCVAEFECAWLVEAGDLGAGERIIYGALARRRRELVARPIHGPRKRSGLGAVVLIAAVTLLVAFAAFRALELLRHVHGPEIVELLKGAGATFLRVNASLLIASAWTIPTGVAIGFHPRLARIAQPLAQIAASYPATAIFPILLIALVRWGGGLGIGSIALMLLGTQWYILFNVIAGATAIPSDLKEVARALQIFPVAAVEES